MGGVVRAIFGGGESAPAPAPYIPPPPPAPPPAPIPEPVPLPEPAKATPMVDEAVVAAKKKKNLIRASQRGGRLSTILSQDDGDSLGG